MLYDLFTQAMKATNRTEFNEIPFAMLRSLSIGLNNDADSPLSASALLHGLRSYCTYHGLSSKLIIQLDADIAAVSRMLDHREIERSIKQQDYGKAIEAIDRRLNSSGDTAENATLHAARRAIAERQNRSRVNVFVGLAVVIAGIGAFALSSYNAASTRSPSRSAPSTPTQAATPLPSPSRPVTAPSPRGSQGAEDIPAPGQASRLFSRGNIRYCLFQEERLDALRPLVQDNAAVADFNERISDWNARCSAYRYRDSDMTAAQADLDARRPELQSQGRRLIRSLR